MKRTEYVDDVILFTGEDIETTIHDESEEQFDPDTLDCESWQDWYSEDLLNLFFDLEENGFRGSFHQLCNFMFDNRKNDGLYIPESFGSSRPLCSPQSRRPPFPAIDEIRKHGVVTHVDSRSCTGPRYTVLGHCKTQTV